MKGKIYFVLAIFAEFLLSLMIALGFISSIAVLPPMFTMLVALFIVQSGDHFIVKEMALVYLLVYITTFIYGPDNFSLDYNLFNKK